MRGITNRGPFWAALLVLTAIALAAPSMAQVTTATIYGRVEDPSGAVIPGASVEVSNEATGVTKNATTNARGEFAIPYVPVGPYTITVGSEGFSTREQTGISLTSGQKVDLTFVLEVGVTTETVSVTAEAPLLNTTSAEQDINLGSEQVDELPMRNRDITSIIALGTGASSDGLTIALNGLPPRGFTFAVDGVNAVPDSEFASLAAYQNYNYIKGISVEAVQGVEVSKNIFSAEIANTLAGNVNIITKGGTNEIHGSAFEQYQAGGLNANNHILARKASLVFHQYGGSLGGPIVKNKLFFFGTFEGYRRYAQRALTGFVPSNSIVDQTVAAIPESRAYWDLWPRATAAPANPDDVVAVFCGLGRAPKRRQYRVDPGATTALTITTCSRCATPAAVRSSGALVLPLATHECTTECRKTCRRHSTACGARTSLRKAVSATTLPRARPCGPDAACRDPADQRRRPAFAFAGPSI